MTRLEKVYLMPVCLHFLTFNDIRRFILVNKKCQETVVMLNVNPFFINAASLIQFCKAFKPTTINLLNLPIFDVELFSSAEYLKQPCFDNFVEKEDEIISVLPKITSFDLGDTTQTGVFLDNVESFGTIQRISGGLSQVSDFIDTYTDSGNNKNILLPKVIHIDMDYSDQLFVNENTIEQVLNIKNNIPNLSETKIYVGFCKHPKQQDKELLLKLEGINYYYYHFTNEQCDILNENYADPFRMVFFDGVNYPNQFNSILNKLYCNNCTLWSAGKFCRDGVIWNIPSFINTCVIKSSSSKFNTETLNNNPFLFDMKYIINLTIIECLDTLLCQEFCSLKQVTLNDCSNVHFNTQNDNKFKYCLDKLEEVYLLNCKFIEINFTTNSLQTIMIEKCDGVVIKGNVNDIKNIHISYSTKCIFPSLSFENKKIHIENSEVSFDNISPLEFMNIKLQEFITLTNSYLALPATSIPNNTDLFCMRKFTSLSKGIKIENNVIKKVQQYPFIPTKKIQFPATIHYFEVEVLGYAVIKIGLMNRDLFDNGDYYDHDNSDEISWTGYSFKYESDSGCLVFGDYDDVEVPYGPIYGKENEKTCCWLWF
ncbi:Uncharacterized protein QTN25_005893 [Entamoeba marina]